LLIFSRFSRKFLVKDVVWVDEGNPTHLERSNIRYI
jgi:hypothetical protein